MIPLGMNQQLGTAWFIFYAKVRPWLACLSSLIVFLDFLMHTEFYLLYWWLLLYFLVSITLAVLAVITFFKSRVYYGTFFRFVKGVLLFETFAFPYMQCVNQSTRLENDVNVVVFFILVALCFPFWYCLNLKYFKRRLIAVNPDSPDNNIQENVPVGEPECNPSTSTPKIRFCKECGSNLANATRFCWKCGVAVLDDYQEFQSKCSFVVCNECKCNLSPDSIFCPFCGSQAKKKSSVDEVPAEKKAAHTKDKPDAITGLWDWIRSFRQQSKSGKIAILTVTVTSVLSCISLVSILLAMVLQDPRRLTEEYTNPNVFYWILVLLFGFMIGFSIYSFKRQKVTVLPWLSLTTGVIAIIATGDGAVFSSSYREYTHTFMSRGSSIEFYNNWEIIEILNAIWLSSTVLIFIFTAIFWGTVVIPKITSKWHSSLPYRERCYKKIKKIHEYYEAGILSEEEYENEKREILKKINSSR